MRIINIINYQYFYNLTSTHLRRPLLIVRRREPREWNLCRLKERKTLPESEALIACGLQTTRLQPFKSARNVDPVEFPTKEDVKKWREKRNLKIRREREFLKNRREKVRVCLYVRFSNCFKCKTLIHSSMADRRDFGEMYCRCRPQLL
jgi:hypothetical protein